MSATQVKGPSSVGELRTETTTSPSVLTRPHELAVRLAPAKEASANHLRVVAKVSEEFDIRARCSSRIGYHRAHAAAPGASPRSSPEDNCGPVVAGQVVAVVGQDNWQVGLCKKGGGGWDDVSSSSLPGQCVPVPSGSSEAVGCRRRARCLPEHRRFARTLIWLLVNGRLCTVVTLLHAVSCTLTLIEKARSAATGLLELYGATMKK